MNKIIRIITFLHYSNSGAYLYPLLKTLPLRKLISQRIGLQMYKYYTGNIPTAMSDLFTINASIHDHNTRQKTNLRQPIANREYMYRNFSFVGVYVWIHITSTHCFNIVSSYTSFKYYFKEYLFVYDIMFVLFRLIFMYECVCKHI